MSIRKGSSIIAGNLGQNIDDTLSSSSTNPVQNSVITYALEDKIGTNQITNCITKLPQHIKLDLTGTALTLKTGSKIFYPNGFEQDGTTLKFDYYTTQSDLTLNVGGSGWTSEPHFITVLSDGSTSAGYASQDVYSGDTAPSSMSSQYGLWYDTTNNIIRRTTDTGSTWSSTPYSFPVCIAINTSGGCENIGQIFTGFGYMDQVVFALPGIEGLVPNGKNEDGTLNNIKWTNSSVIIRTNANRPSVDADKHSVFAFNPTEPIAGYKFAHISQHCYRYDEKQNRIYELNDDNSGTINKEWPYTLIGYQSSPNIYFNQPFQALDCSNTAYIAHQAMPVNEKYLNLTIGATGTSYTAYTDGWVYVETATSTANQGWVSVNVNNTYTSGLDIDRTGVGKVFIPIKKCTPFTITYGGTTISKLRFFYTVGSI